MKQISYILYTENNMLEEILKFKCTNCVCKNGIIQEYNSLEQKEKLQKSCYYIFQNVL